MKLFFFSFCNTPNILELYLFTLGPQNLLVSMEKGVYTLFGYPLVFAMVYFNGMFIEELETHARIFLLKYRWG